MNKLDTHIRNTVLVAMLVLFLVITLVDFVFSLAEEIGDTEGQYTLLDALGFVTLNTATRVYELLPFSVLGGALVGLGVLASNNEIVVMQAAGINVIRIVWSVLKPAMVIAILNLVVGEYVSPPLEQLAQSNKARILGGNSVAQSSRGTWLKVGSEYIHINSISSSGEYLYGITRYEIDKNRHLQAASFSESAEYIPKSKGGVWYLYGVRESLFEHRTIATREYLQREWVINLSPNFLRILIIVPDRLSISGLRRLTYFLESEGLDAGEYSLAFWKKLLQPLTTVALVILAISFVFGPLRESTMGKRVFTAMAVGLVFTILQRMMEPISLLFGLSPFFAALAPVLLVLTLGIVLFRRVR